MNVRVAAGAWLALVTLVLVAGCRRPDSVDDSASGSTAVAGPYSTKVVLGAAELTAGIPGSGPLTVDQVRHWLAQTGVHDPLEFELPWNLTDAASLVFVPPENPLTRAKIELGRQLFFDPRLSEFGTMSCATCHLPEQDFSAHATMPGTHRNPPVCFNRLFSTRQSWNGRDASLEHQIEGPVTAHFEMATTPEDCVRQLQAVEGYRLQFDAIFGRLDFDAVRAALASFQRALVTGPSPWDYKRLLSQYENRDPEALSDDDRRYVDELRAGAREHAMSAAAIRGEALFFSERTKCHTCHSGPNLTDELFHNTGAGMDDLEPDLGRYLVTGREEDRGAFKTPTLRNVARTSPYMHNGQFGTLREVVDWFDQGGYRHADLDRALRPLNLTRDEKRDLVAFLEALTGPLPAVEAARLPN